MAAVESPTYAREKVNGSIYAVETWLAIIDCIEQQKPPAVVRGNAACAGQGVDRWFPGQGQDPKAAKAVCGACDVVDQCREWAIKQPNLEGVWGGLTAAERRTEDGHTRRRQPAA